MQEKRSADSGEERQYHGMVVPLVTPLDENERVDVTALRRIVRHVLKAGVHGLFVNSTSGEAVCLADAEKKRALDVVVEENGGATPVYAGISDTGTRRTLDNLKWSEKAGADVVVAHPPYYFPPNQDSELIDYYTRLADSCSRPLMLYNIPFTTQAPLTVGAVREMLAHPNIIGIKDSSTDFGYLLELIELKKERSDFAIFIGKTQLWTAGMLSGADGGLDGISNLIPDRCTALYRAIAAGSKVVYAMQREINAIWRVYECRSFLAGIKTALSLMGLCRPYTTHPILGASVEEKEKIAVILRSHGLIE